MSLIWLVIFIVFIIIEMLTSNLVTIWFAIGALGAFIATYITDSEAIQCIVFTMVTVISLIATRPIVKKLFKEPIKTNLDSVVGQIGIVEEKIKPNALGRVVVSGKNWAAKSDKLINAGSEVEVTAIDGVKLIVKKKGDE